MEYKYRKTAGAPVAASARAAAPPAFTKGIQLVRSSAPLPRVPGDLLRDDLILLPGPGQNRYEGGSA